MTERPPMWALWAAPVSRWYLSLLGGVTVGAILVLAVNAPGWTPGAAVFVIALAVETHWRVTRPPSDDRPWPAAVRWLFRRAPARDAGDEEARHRNSPHD